MDTNSIYIPGVFEENAAVLTWCNRKESLRNTGLLHRQKLFARIKEDGETLVITSARRDKWMQLYPDVYFVTDHYLNYAYVLAHLDKADPEQLKEVLLIAWRTRATKKLIDEFDRNNL
jgi:hypothetical protein